MAQRPSGSCWDCLIPDLVRAGGGYSRYCVDALFAGQVARSFPLVFDF